MSVKRRNSQPLNPALLEELALGYVARFATTQARLAGYLQRKLRERGWDNEHDPQVEELVSRYAQRGYIDDAAWARMKAGSLLRRGYGARRVSEALGQAGIEEDLRGGARPSQAEQRQAALVMARRRHFGPFAVQPLERPAREKQIAAMLRAGHSLDIARRIVNASDPDEAEEWAESVFGDD